MDRETLPRARHPHQKPATQRRPKTTEKNEEVKITAITAVKFKPRSRGDRMDTGTDVTETSEARANLRTAIWAVRRPGERPEFTLTVNATSLVLCRRKSGWMRSPIRRSVSHCLKANDSRLDDDWLDVEREQYRRRQLTRLAGLARNAGPPGKIWMRHDGRLSGAAWRRSMRVPTASCYG